MPTLDLLCSQLLFETHCRTGSVALTESTCFGCQTVSLLASPRIIGDVLRSEAVKVARRPTRCFRTDLQDSSDAHMPVEGPQDTCPKKSLTSPPSYKSQGGPLHHALATLTHFTMRLHLTNAVAPGSWLIEASASPSSTASFLEGARRWRRAGQRLAG